MENRSIWAQDSRSTRLYRSRRSTRVTSMDTQAAMRFAVMLQIAAPQAITIISPPERQMAFRSPAGTQSSMIWASSSGRINSRIAAVNLMVTPQHTRRP